MSERYLYEEVKNMVETQSTCKLLSTEYKNNVGKLLFACECGNNFETSFVAFANKGKKQCNECGAKIRSLKQSNALKKPLKDIIEYININTDLLFLNFPDGYKNSLSKIELQCICGDSFVTIVQKLLYRDKHQCNKCGIEKGKNNFQQALKEKRSSINTSNKINFKKRIPVSKPKKINSKGIFKIIKYINENTALMFLGFPDGYKNEDSIVKLQCICGEVFETRTKNLLYKQKHQCNSCGRNILAKKRRSTYEEVSQRIENNTKFELLEYNIETGDLVLECQCGSVLNTTLKKLYNITTCRECSNEKLRRERRKPIKDIVDHISDNTDCLFLGFVEGYKNSFSKIKMQCLCGNVFETAVVKIFDRNKHQCNDCGDKILGEKKITDIDYIEEFITKNSKSKLIERRKIKRRTYRLVLQCHCGETYSASFSKFKQGFSRMCPVCCKSTSHGEIEVKMQLEKMDLNFKQEHYIKYKNQGMYIDFLIYDDKTPKYAIEFDGKQHFEPIDFFGGLEGFEDTVRRDELKNEYCMAKKIPLLRIPYTEFHNIQEIVSDFNSRFFNA